MINARPDEHKRKDATQQAVPHAPENADHLGRLAQLVGIRPLE
jgi:hypothetical protein